MSLLHRLYSYFFLSHNNWKLVCFGQVEHVIKDQNMLDVYGRIEGYFNLLIERVHLIEQERLVYSCNFVWWKNWFSFFFLKWWVWYSCYRECPEELKEAASGLLYAASRCGDFPEIQQIRVILTSRFGKEFAARSIELRNNCGVHPQVCIWYEIQQSLLCLILLPSQYFVLPVRLVKN